MSTALLNIKQTRWFLVKVKSSLPWIESVKKYGAVFISTLQMENIVCELLFFDENLNGRRPEIVSQQISSDGSYENVCCKTMVRFWLPFLLT